MLTPSTALVVAAHPDDETIGAGAQLAKWSGVQVVHVTDGAPRDRRWWGISGPPARGAYAGIRGAELHAALALAGVDPARVHSLGIADQEAYLHLPELTRQLGRLIATVHPDVILTHPYEGGHPDHDSAAFAVHVDERFDWGLAGEKWRLRAKEAAYLLGLEDLVRC